MALLVMKLLVATVSSSAQQGDPVSGSHEDARSAEGRLAEAAVYEEVRSADARVTTITPDTTVTPPDTADESPDVTESSSIPFFVAKATHVVFIPIPKPTSGKEARKASKNFKRAKRTLFPAASATESTPWSAGIGPKHKAEMCVLDLVLWWESDAEYAYVTLAEEVFISPGAPARKVDPEWAERWKNGPTFHSSNVVGVLPMTPEVEAMLGLQRNAKGKIKRNHRSNNVRRVWDHSLDHLIERDPARWPDPRPEYDTTHRGGNESLAEFHARKILEETHVVWTKVRPDWLKSPKSGSNLELDFYSPAHTYGGLWAGGSAVEVDGGQHFRPGFGATDEQFEKSQWNDRYKSWVCPQRRVRLLRIDARGFNLDTEGPLNAMRGRIWAFLEDRLLDADYFAEEAAQLFAEHADAELAITPVRLSVHPARPSAGIRRDNLLSDADLDEVVSELFGENRRPENEG